MLLVQERKSARDGEGAIVVEITGDCIPAVLGSSPCFFANKGSGCQQSLTTLGESDTFCILLCLSRLRNPQLLSVINFFHFM